MGKKRNPTPQYRLFKVDYQQGIIVLLQTRKVGEPWKYITTRRSIAGSEDCVVGIRLKRRKKLFSKLFSFFGVKNRFEKNGDFVKRLRRESLKIRLLVKQIESRLIWCDEIIVHQAGERLIIPGPELIHRSSDFFGLLIANNYVLPCNVTSNNVVAI